MVGTETKQLTESFSLLVHEDRRLNGEAAGYFEVEYNGDLAQSLR